MGKIKILFIVSEFYQSGTSRFTYEINKALNKEKFEVSFLSLTPLNNSDLWDDYYHEKHKELDSEIYYFHDFNTSFKPTIRQRLERKIFGKEFPSKWQELINFIDKFDVISLMGEYNFYEVNKFLNQNHLMKLFVHPQNSIYQVPENYVHYDKSFHFRFVSAFLKNDLPIEFGEFKSFDHTYLPLSFEIKNETPLWVKPQNNVKKIGLFSRIAKSKPLDPFIYTFQNLINSLPNCELHIFGSGNPEEEGVMRYINQLGLEKSIIFRGHQKDMIGTAKKESLDLVWLHGYHSVPGGWAGYDICTLGIPQVFWNFGGVERPELSEIFPMYNNTNKFAEKSLKVIQDNEYAYKLSQTQFDYVLQNQNIAKFIGDLENTYLGS